MTDSRWTIGDVVHDRDDDDPDPAIVVNTRDTPAEEWDLPRLDTTLAEDNPDYPSDAPVVTVLFEDTLTDSFPDWDRNAPISYPTLDDSDLRYYSFPAPRLESGEPPEATDPATETDDEATSSSRTGECETDGPADADTDAEPSTSDASQEPSETVRTLQKRLDDGGMTTTIEDDNRTIRASKLGETYRVRPGEVLDGEGPFRSRLEDIVTDVQDSN
ncbi:hypothetical protein [Saliphagus infecundisoli]|uniref:Uncharacterized protein n=1 Tax=Saliphagus infecundisoli TaxID=1849069 RepID=A0ABD5QIG5_9EURY|nr:hypothetical protein [Saliphagus infecundisoli]